MIFFNFNLPIILSLLIIAKSNMKKQSQKKAISQINVSSLTDEYQILQQIAKGSYGRVFKVREKYGKRQYRAIKQMTIDPLSDEQWDEVKNLKAFTNDHIVQFYGYIIEANELNIVMQYCKGNLRDIMIKKTKFTPQDIVNLMTQVTSAMLTLSKNNLMHLDLKPENILYQDQNYYKLCDFGRSQSMLKISNANYLMKTKPSLIKPYFPSIFPIKLPHREFGTAQYIAPEVQLDLDINSYSCDIWSFGIILYEIIFGKHPIGINKLKRVESKDFNRFMSGQIKISFDNPQGEGYPIQILERMLKPDPQQRISWNKIKQELISKYGKIEAEFINLEQAVASQIKMSLILASLVHLIDENIALNQNGFWKNNQNEKRLTQIKKLMIEISYLQLIKFERLFNYKKDKMSPTKQLQLKFLREDIKHELEQLNPEENFLNTLHSQQKNLSNYQAKLLQKLKDMQHTIEKQKQHFESVRSLAIFYEQFKKAKTLFCQGNNFPICCQVFDINEQAADIGI